VTRPCAIICLTGSELTRGETRDANGSFLATELTMLGIHVKEILLLPDNRQQLEETFGELAERADILIISGGLGPTADDLTISALAAALGQEVTIDPTARESMRCKALQRVASEAEIPDNFYKQGEVVEGATVLQNPAGLAPASLVETGRGLVAALPGVPYELRAIFHEHLADEIARRLNLSPPRILRAKLMGRPESWAEARIQELDIDTTRIEYGISARPGELLLKFISHEENGHTLLDGVRQVLATEFGEDLFFLPEGLKDPAGEPLDISLMRRVHELLLSNRASVATAESCTGGLIAKRLTDRAGSSQYFLGSTVAYQNTIKVSMLDVEETVIESKGAVSREVCEAMARAARNRFSATYGISVTGIAGPGGGSDQKPVGLVYIGLAGPEEETCYVEKKIFSGGRDLVRAQAATRALDLLRRSLEGEPP
jgi:nicotinamide-nucleotide amidase